MNKTKKEPLAILVLREFTIRWVVGAAIIVLLYIAMLSLRVGVEFMTNNSLTMEAVRTGLGVLFIPFILGLYLWRSEK